MSDFEIALLLLVLVSMVYYAIIAIVIRFFTKPNCVTDNDTGGKEEENS